jgi:hypothetical protein
VAVKIIECWEPLPGANPRPLDARAQAAVQGSQAAVVEALLARSLSHPHIVTTFCHGMSSEEVRCALCADVVRGEGGGERPGWGQAHLHTCWAAGVGEVVRCCVGPPACRPPVCSSPNQAGP